MIVRLTGKLLELDQNRAVIELPDGLCYEVLLPAFAAGRLGGQLQQTITLFTFHYLESQGQGNSFIPRLAGFLSLTDKQFFELFTTCKNIGNRKALRAMAIDSGQIAAAIADRDVAMLQSLPEIGKRSAETIIATLRDKVDRFIAASAYGKSSSDESPRSASQRSIASEAMEVLLQLGENRAEAMRWIDQALQNDPPPEDAQDLLQLVYAIKASGR